MKNVTRHIGKLEIIERLKNSVNGNPRYLLRIDGVTCKTGVDSLYGYDILNHRDKTVVATIGIHYGVVILHTLEGV